MVSIKEDSNSVRQLKLRERNIGFVIRVKMRKQRYLLSCNLAALEHFILYVGNLYVQNPDRLLAT